MGGTVNMCVNLVCPIQHHVKMKSLLKEFNSFSCYLFKSSFS